MAEVNNLSIISATYISEDTMSLYQLFVSSVITSIIANHINNRNLFPSEM